MAPQATGRRAEYAAATRDAILAAARELFVSQGYFGTRVEDIARTARVAPATVYAVGGGKNGLLRELIETAVRSGENDTIRARLSTHTDARELISFVVDTSRAKFEQWSPLMRQVIAAAPREPGVRESLDVAHASLRDTLARTADRLAELGALRPGLDAAAATDVLWFYLGNSAYFTMTDDLSWSLPRAAAWLEENLTFALLGPSNT
ncbi:TetR/AcrR family transcriptional regulator [Winogradskya consettensis]|uniref:TetR family transcriptional regulator n=1 Tax=Winogradskya consettensis TaxID=113560 RepID=A0A919VQV9_9ACTN|nr:TetR/AcrR family transcriptional regulator [Actinoplanes consettensis]GIM66006.1 TetR family transcriptional regulator [Actinoplanes consettensis]